MYNDFFFNGIPDVKRNRTLDPLELKENLFKEDSPDKDAIRQDYADSIFEQYTKSIEKATVLIKAIEPIANKYRIPIPEESIEIRQAVKRKDPLADNNFITFELFQRCVDTIEFYAKQVDFNVINDKVTADPLANLRKVKKFLNKSLDGDDINLLLSLGEQFLVLYLIHVMSGIWRGPEVAVANPTPPGIAEAAREMAIGFAVGFTVLNINKTLASSLAQNGSTNSPNIRSIIDGAIGAAGQTQLPPLLAQASKVIGLDDHKTILKYCINFISSSIERGYEFWLVYLSVRRTRYQSSRSLSLSPIFSNKQFAANNGLSDLSSINPDNILINNPRLQGQRTIGQFIGEGVVSALNRSISDPTYEILCVQEQESSSFINGLNEIAQVLDTKFTRDAVCCLVRFLSNLDISLLKKIRGLIAIFLNAQLINLNVDFNKFLVYLIDWIRDSIERLILALLQSIIDKILKTILKFLTDTLNDIDYLLECPLILELIQSILDGVFYILNDLNTIIKNYVRGIVYSAMNSLSLNSLTSVHNKNTTGLYKIYRKRSLRRLLTIIDKIIQIIESGAVICDDDKEVSQKYVTYDNILDSDDLNDIEDYLNINDNIKEQFFNDAKEIVLKDGTVIPDYRNNVINIGNPTSEQAQKDCVAFFGQDILTRMIPNEFRR